MATEEEHTLELAIFMVGCNHQEALDKRNDILTDLKRIYGIRKLGDMGLCVTLEYRKPEHEWTVSSALSQIHHGTQGSPKWKSALQFLEDYYRLEM